MLDEKTCFNSLQTGKPIQSVIVLPKEKFQTIRFNSLQTGKPIQRRKVLFQNGTHLWRMFQFPSNGKAYPKLEKRGDRGKGRSLFQFPSNGKAYPKNEVTGTCCVSGGSFNSLQTGKPIQSQLETASDFVNPSVSIPFKRESLSKGYNEIQREKREESVSIPFKRESLSKEIGEKVSIGPYYVTFQFPSNGKAYPKQTDEDGHCATQLMFQFPSNGKAYPKKKKNN